jgi:O-acetylhomoserine (thiol)-lyase
MGYNPDSAIETKCVQAGWQPKNGEPRVLPIYESTTYKYDTSAEMAKLFDLEPGYMYTRLANPTNDAVANKIACLEGGVGAVLTSSGQAANFFALINILGAGDHIVSSATIYGGTFNLLNVTMRKIGVEVTFVDPRASEEEINAAFRDNTKAMFGETIANPSLDVLDIEKFAKIAHSHGVPLIVDNTFPTPINCRPFEFGADIVTHSTTKYMEGHASTIGGCVVDSGNFDWYQNDKFPGLTTPDESYHGVTYAKDFGKNGYIVKIVAQLLRDYGSTPSPFNSFLLNIGLESLAVRVERHCENAQKVAEYLEKNDKIAWVNYPGLKSSKDYELAQKYLPHGTCGVISFGVKGGREKAEQFMNSLKLAAIVTHVADARTCVLHPASSTHRQLSDEELTECGVTPDAVPQELMDKIIEAGLYAPSGMNKQSPIIIAVTDRKMRDEISEMNREIGGWQEGFDPFYGAPAILIVLANKECRTAVYDGSLTMGNLMLAAHNFGLGSCWIHRAKEEFESEKGKAILKKLGINGEYEGIGHCALGYADEEPKGHNIAENRIYHIK